MSSRFSRLLLASLALGLAVALPGPARAQLGMDEVAPRSPTGSNPTGPAHPGGPTGPVVPAEVQRGSRVTVVAMPQGSGNLDLAAFLEAVRQKAPELGPRSLLLVGDVGHHMVQQVGEGTRVQGGEWNDFAARREGGIYAPSIKPEQLELFTREWAGRFYAYEHHGPVASLQAKQQGLPNAASMVVRDFPALEAALRATATRLGAAEANAVIVIHDFSDADAVTTRLLLEELATRALDGTRTGAPIDPLLRHMATEWAARADQGRLGLELHRIDQTLEGVLEGLNYELETRGLEGEALSREQVRQATELMKQVMETARAQGLQAIPEASMPDLLRAAVRGNELFEAGEARAEAYGREVTEMKRLALEAATREGPGAVVRRNGQGSTRGFEFVESASIQEIWVENASGGRHKALTLVLEITKPPISKAAFWTAYAPTGGAAAELVLIQGKGFVNWFMGAKRGLSLRTVTARWADAAPTRTGNSTVFEAGRWRQNFPAFKGAAYDWAISLGSMQNLMDGSASIHELAADMAAEGRRLAGAEAGPVIPGVRVGGLAGEPVLVLEEATRLAEALRQEARAAAAEGTRGMTEAQALADAARKVETRVAEGGVRLSELASMPEVVRAGPRAVRVFETARTRSRTLEPGAPRVDPIESRPRIRVPRGLP